MSRWSELLLDVNYMKENAVNAARIITIDISKLGRTMVDGYRMREAVIKRYQLDRLLFDEQSLIDKWAQFIVQDSDRNIVFRGSKEECQDFVKKHSVIWLYELEVLQVFPDDRDFNWGRYFRKIERKSDLEIDF